MRKWFQHLAAKILVGMSNEQGGLLHDYANGRYILLRTWSNLEGAEETLAQIDNMFNNGRDAIWIATIKCDVKAGFFVVHDSDRKVYCRYFWDGYYTPSEAFKDVAFYCRDRAKEMGWANPHTP